MTSGQDRWQQMQDEIGEFTEKSSGLTIFHSKKRLSITPFEQDEITRAL